MGTSEDKPWLTTVERAAKAFFERFGVPHELTAFAPGRINLIGEHTDYNGGLVLPTTISRYCVAVGRPTIGPRSRLLAVDIGESYEFEAGGDLARYLSLPEPQGTKRGGWASYVLGVLDEFRRRGAEVPPMDIAIASDIPIGSGLSSSAALEVSVARLAQSAFGCELDRLELARLCREAEHEFAGVPCGIMDQFAVLFGEPAVAVLIDCGTEQAVAVPLSPEGQFLVVDTRVRHKLADGEYAKRRAACASAAKKLGVELLCQVDDEARLSSAGLTAEELRCARHVLSESHRVEMAVDALADGDLAAFGRLMFESHESLRNDYRVSCPELDTVVEAACGLEGVFGARMTGGGFGGCAILLAEPSSARDVSKAVEAAYSAKHGRACTIFAAHEAS